jgi:hypothetical protein
MAQREVVLLQPTTLTATTVGVQNQFDRVNDPIQNWPDFPTTDAFVAELNISGPVTGTTPTLNAKIETSYDNGDTWVQVVAFAQQTAVTATPVTAAIAAGTYGAKLRYNIAIGGTTPSFGGVEIVLG